MSENEKLQQTSKEDKAAKNKKDAKKSKPSVFARIGKWFKDMKAELKKVVWPTPQQVLKNTLVVVCCVLVVGVFIWLFDFVAQVGIDALIGLFH